MFLSPVKCGSFTQGSSGPRVLADFESGIWLGCPTLQDANGSLSEQPSFAVTLPLGMLSSTSAEYSRSP